MKKKLLMIMTAMLMGTIGICHAQDLEPLHVDGRYLKNPKGDIVTLHGLMMAVGDGWCEERKFWQGEDYEGAVRYEKQWVDSVLTLGWKIDYIRILVTNGWISENASGAYDLGAFKRNNNFEKVYVPIIEHLNSKGIYAVLYYDGIRPEDDLHQIGDQAQQYAIEFWDYISSHPYVKNNPGVMMELYNEPAKMLGSDGRLNDAKDVKNYFQPMVDVIRRNGCDNVVWIPGMGLQCYYSNYAVHPIEGENIGYAFHGYFIGNTWDREITPVCNMAPCLITEMGWWNENDDEDETSTFGIAQKRDIDRMGNVGWNPLVDAQGIFLQVNQPSPDGSMTVYNDPEAFMVPTYNWYKEYAETKIMSTSQLKAVSVEMEDAPTSVFPGESCAMKLMAKFADGRSWNVAGDAVWTSSDESVLSIDRGNIYVKKAGQTTIHGTYTDGTSLTFEVQFDVVSSMFPLTATCVNYFDREFPNQFDEATKSFSGAGSGGWFWTDGIDLSAYHYLVVRFSEGANFPATLNIHDAKERALSTEVAGQTEVVIDLQQAEDIDLSCVKTVDFWTLTESDKLYVKEMFLSNDGMNPAESPTMRTLVYADDKSMIYGDEVPELTYSVVGTAPSQTPTLSTVATKTSPVGTYEITQTGSEDGVDYQSGTLQVLPAPLTVTTGDIVIGAGMDIPALTLTYEGFRNGDTETTALSEKPTVTTTATKDSPCGNYDITVSGGSSANYDMACYGGTLTITPNQTIALPANRTSHVGTSQEDWQAWGVCSTEFAPTVTTADGRTAQMVECYEETVNTMGTMMEQTVTGLEDGNYTLVLCANAYYTDGRGFPSGLKEGATDVVCLHANDVTVPMTAHIGTATTKNNEYTLEVTVTSGTLHISMEKLKVGTNWHTLQIKSLTLTRQLSLEEAYTKTLAEAEELLPKKMDIYAKKALQQGIAAEHTYVNLYRLTEAIAQARKSIEAMRFAKSAIEVMKNELLTSTNVCTPEAEREYREYCEQQERAYEDDWMTDDRAYFELYNPYEGGGGWGFVKTFDFLMSAWEQDAPYGVGFEFGSDNDFFPPSISYHAQEGSTTLAARTLTATMTDMEPGEYTLTAFVRLIAVDGNVAPKGVSLQLCDGTPVP
ncbi:MAG: cellulase family glycosylhydrolase, partial [Bacteroidaceae bacterium]|nr:cellulase family glycosylhydrolase [Bacteroidaceae bacterium]